MQTTIELLTTVKSRYHLQSDGRLAALLGHTRQSISLLMAGKNYLGDEAALKVADLLEMDPAYVIACMHAEREKNQEVRKVWEQIAGRMAVAVSILLFIGGVSGELVSPALSDIKAASAPGLYIMSNLFSAYWWILLPLFSLWLATLPRHNSTSKK